MPGKHATLSASGAHRWLACTPSARLEETLPETLSSYASEGTLAHSLGDLLLRKQFQAMKPSVYKKELDKIQADPQYTPAMMEHCAGYRDYVVESANAFKTSPVVAIEQRVDYSEYVPEGYGTCDNVIIGDSTMRVTDLKYGAGVPVSAEDNPQLRLYGLGALLMFKEIYDIDTVVLTIFQPRLDSISTVEMTAAELLAWAKEIRPQALLAYDGEGEFVAGEHCRFCRAKAICRARAEANLEAARYEFAKPDTLTDEEIGDILKRSEELAAWAKDIAEYALVQARDHDKQFAGWKLVEGRSVRVYKDQDAVEDTLVAAGFARPLITKTQLLGITEMEKVVGGPKKFTTLLGDLIDKPAGKPTLVPESDKRPAINSIASAVSDFKEESING